MTKLNSLEIGRGCQHSLEFFNTPYSSLSNNVLYLSHIAGIEENKANTLAQEICSLATELGAKNTIDTQATTHSNLLVETMTSKDAPKYNGSRPHLYSRLIVTGLKAGFSLQVAHEFAVKTIELFKEMKPKENTLKLSIGVFKPKENRITILQSDQKSGLHLEEIYPADKQDDGKYKIEYPEGSPYDIAIRQAKEMTLFS